LGIRQKIYLSKKIKKRVEEIKRGEEE